MSKVALITGITGQDGSYLAEFLLEKGYEVHGVIRRSSVDYRERIAHLEGHPSFHLHYGDLSDSMSILSVVSTVRPDEIYNLAAQSHVQVSFDVPEFTADVDATGVLRVLEAVRLCGLKDRCRIYQASTSELYGKVEEVPQNENTPFHPYSPYAVAKQYGFWIVKEYREAYNMWELIGLWLETNIINLCMWVLSIVIFVIVYGRMIEIYRASRSAAFHPRVVRGHFGNPALASR